MHVSILFIFIFLYQIYFRFYTLVRCIFVIVSLLFFFSIRCFVFLDTKLFEILFSLDADAKSKSNERLEKKMYWKFILIIRFFFSVVISFVFGSFSFELFKIYSLFLNAKFYEDTCRRLKLINFNGKTNEKFKRMFLQFGVRFLLAKDSTFR